MTEKKKLKALEWQDKTLEQRAIAVGESKITATSILGLLDEKYKGQLKAAPNPAKFAARWALLRAKALNPEMKIDELGEASVEEIPTEPAVQE